MGSTEFLDITGKAVAPSLVAGVEGAPGRSSERSDDAHVGSVVSPGAVVMTLVPHNDPMQAEVWVTNQDAGFVVPKQAVRLKIAAYTFQKYGMIEAEVKQISPDATELAESKGEKNKELQDNTSPSSYRTLVTFKTPYLEVDGKQHKLSPGMQVSAEINLGTRSVIEYLLSPVSKTVHEAGRER